MKGKTAAALLGVGLGVGIVIFIELMDVWLDEGVFFGSWWSWLLLALLVVIMPFLMVRAYHNKRGIYSEQEKPPEDPHEKQDPN